MTTTTHTTTGSARRLHQEAARARITPNPTRLAALTAQLRRLTHRQDYLPGYTAVLEKAIHTIGHYHTQTCTQPGCTTCAAIRIGVTAITAHHHTHGGTR